MRIAFDTKDIKAALSMVGKAIPSRPSLPILGCVVIRADGDAATILGSNTDITMQVECRADMGSDGVFVLPFEPLAAFVGAAKAGTVVIEDDGTVKSGRSRIKLALDDVELYPFSASGIPAMASIPCAPVREAVSFCASSVEDSEVKYHIAGVRIMHDDHGETHFWGTDGRSVHHVRMAEIHGMEAATIPLAACGVIGSILDGQDDAEMALTERSWAVRAAGVTAWGKVIDGGYPDMDRATGQFAQWDDVAGAPVSDLCDALAMAAIGTERSAEKSRSVIVKAVAGGDALTMRGHKGAAGVTTAGRAEMDVETIADIGVIINADKLRKAAQGLGGHILIQNCDNRAIRITGDIVGEAEAIIMAAIATTGELADV